MSSIDEARERAPLVARWRELTSEILPSMAADAGWSIKLDHCFMRVCLDTSLGAPWTQRIGRPAIRTMSTSQLRAAVDVAERIVRAPGDLHGLNMRSIQARRAAISEDALPSAAASGNRGRSAASSSSG